VPEDKLAVALRANPAVEWYLRHKCPDINRWLDHVLAKECRPVNQDEIRPAELSVLNAINDLLVYVIDPTIYDSQPFLGWDSNELTSLVDFRGKTVLDIGAGTGRLTFVAAEKAEMVFAIEPVANLRYYLKEKAREKGLANIYPVDGLITQIPFPNNFADVSIGGHVFGENPEEEYREMARVTRDGGEIILCPGNNDLDNTTHHFLVSAGFRWSRFEEPGAGMKRKYWKTA